VRRRGTLREPPHGGRSYGVRGGDCKGDVLLGSHGTSLLETPLGVARQIGREKKSHKIRGGREGEFKTQLEIRKKEYRWRTGVLLTVEGRATEKKILESGPEKLSAV